MAYCDEVSKATMGKVAGQVSSLQSGTSGLANSLTELDERMRQAEAMLKNPDLMGGGVEEVRRHLKGLAFLFQYYIRNGSDAKFANFSSPFSITETERFDTFTWLYKHGPLLQAQSFSKFLSVFKKYVRDSSYKDGSYATAKH